MIRLVLALSILLPSFSSFASDPYPISPDTRLTPGSLCTRPDSYRYAEHIPYCNRDVSGNRKQAIIQTYDKTLGYRISEMKRNDFKIDHYIPLCMGGSNRTDNLWPQHESVFTVTDPLEQLACEKMAAGRLRQAEAVEIIRRAKADLVEARRLIEYVRNL